MAAALSKSKSEQILEKTMGESVQMRWMSRSKGELKTKHLPLEGLTLHFCRSAQRPHAQAQDSRSASTRHIRAKNHNK